MTPELWASCRLHLSALSCLVVGCAGVVAVEFAHPAAYDAPSLRAAVETVMTLFALAAAWLFRGQVLHSRRFRDAVLVGALLTLGLLHLFSYALSAALDLGSGGAIAATADWGELLVAGMFAVAALASADRVLGDPRRSLAITAVFSFVTVAVAVLLALLVPGQHAVVASHAPAGIRATQQHPLTPVLELAAAGLLARAAMGFARRERIGQYGVAGPLAAAMILLAAACISELALPQLAPDEIALREVLRLVAFVLLLLAAAREEVRMRTVLARDAWIAERRRVARDLHDGLAQDLAFIAAHAERIARELGAEHPVVIAAQSALEISRNKIAELSHPVGTTLSDALQFMAHELGGRFAITIKVDVDQGLQLASSVQEHLCRIVREAIANAARHGGAKNVLVSLNRCEGAIRLRVFDDGCGIDKVSERDGPVRDGFGLRSMRERAIAVGGELSVRTRAIGGTELEVVVR